MKMEENNGKPHREEVCPGKKDKLDLQTIRETIAQTKGPEYWRSLEELAGSEEFREMMHREFPKGASEWLDGVSRRGFLKLMGASMALAGMTACTKQPLEPIVPYVKQPEELIPGRPLFYATAMQLGAYATPLLVESHMGRPTKIEGNAEHHVSRGGPDIFSQASWRCTTRTAHRRSRIWATHTPGARSCKRFVDPSIRKKRCRVPAFAS
jgi:MoCo/4Fe-4S cofactor protein with predicted Tat translocation signal